jgi:GAF domain-containing protein
LAAKRTTKSEEPVSRFWIKINLMAEIMTALRKEPLARPTYLKILDLIKIVVPFDSATLFLHNRKSKQLEEIVTHGDKLELIDFVQFEFGSGLNAWAAQQKKPILLSNIKNMGRPPEQAKSSLLIIPLLAEDNPIGVISFAHAKPDFFREKDVKLLSIIGDQIALSIERLFYQNELEKKNQALQKAQRELRANQRNLIFEEKLEAVRQLAVSINHEINNPLSVIVGHIQCLMYLDKNLDPRLAERLRIIESESLKIAEINRRLLKIDDLVSETYINDSSKIKMINLQKSSAGV